jgi:protease-4
MGDVAASGGYYIAAAAAKIYASPTTITGSIGVFGGKVVYGGMLDKIGVNTVVIARGKNAGLFSGLGRFSDSERAAIKASMEHVYKTFVNRVAKGRNMSFDAVDKVAQGRVWTGAQAHEVGLVDRLGGLQAAIREAARLSRAWPNDTAPRVELYPRKRSLFDLFGGASAAPRLRFGGMLLRLAGELPTPIATPARRLARVFEALVSDQAVLAMMPMAIDLR